jgi:hypothetical protein
MTEIGISRNYFSKGKPVDQDHEFVDCAGLADGRGSSELGLAAALGQGGLPRGWRREGRDAARPGDRSPELWRR